MSKPIPNVTLSNGVEMPILGTSKTRREVRFLGRAAERLNLHGKEGVDGSSPSEGFTSTSAVCQLHRYLVAGNDGRGRLSW